MAVKTLAELAEQFDIHPNQITQWKSQLQQGTAGVLVERIWKSIKYEEVYRHAYASVSEAHQSIGRHINLYNATRQHSSLNVLTPDQICFNRLPESLAA
jgi:uncharacterized protein YjcR